MQIHAFLLEEGGRDTRRDHVSRLMPLIFPELRSPPKNSFLRQQFPRHDFLSPSNTGTEVIKSRVPERSCLRSVDDAFHHRGRVSTSARIRRNCCADGVG